MSRKFWSLLWLIFLLESFCLLKGIPLFLEINNLQFTIKKLLYAYGVLKSQLLYITNYMMLPTNYSFLLSAEALLNLKQLVTCGFLSQSLFTFSILFNFLIFIGLIFFKAKIKAFLVKHYWVYILLTTGIIVVSITPLFLMLKDTYVLTGAIENLETSIDAVVLQTDLLYPKNLRAGGFFFDVRGNFRFCFSKILYNCYPIFSDGFIAENPRIYGGFLFIGTFICFLFGTSK